MSTSDQRIGRAGGALLLIALALGPAASAQVVELEQVASGLTMPLGLTHAGDGSGRLFILQQGGRVLIHDGSALSPEPFLDLTSVVSCCGERGLLGLAFHPDYRRNGRLFVNYTEGGETVISELSVSADPNRADAGSERELLRFAQPFSNHNGGHLAFGPDGFLYIASGDGGSGGDPQNNGQSLGTLLGKILRIDVDRGAPYGIPPGNPFAAGGGADEIWAYGLRNPWRFSFDRKTGDLYIGDVGQNRIEEIDFQRASSGGGENYGWRRMEGAQCFEPAAGCDDGTLTLPVLQYDHGQGCSVTAGFRYRGPEADTLPRFFVFGDFCSGRIWGGRADRAGNWRMRLLRDTNLAISSFGEDQSGHLYVVDYGGAVYRLRGRPLFASDFESGDTSDWSSSSGGLEVVEPGLARSDHALEVPVDGTRMRRFLRSAEPAGETIFAVELLVNANRVDLGGGEVEILRLEGATDPAVVTLGQQGRRYLVRLYVRDNDGELSLAGSTRVPRRRARAIGVDFLAARTPDGADGEVSLLKRGKAKVVASGLRNGRQRVDSVAIGLPAGSAAAVGGAFLIDRYTSSP